MKVWKGNTHQKQFLFEQEEIWQQLPAEAREKVTELLAEILRDFYLRREGNADE